MTTTNFVIVRQRTGNQKITAETAKYKLGARTVKYKLGAGIIEYKLGPGTGKRKYPEICYKFISNVVVSVISRFTSPALSAP